MIIRHENELDLYALKALCYINSHEDKLDYLKTVEECKKSVKASREALESVLKISKNS